MSLSLAVAARGQSTASGALSGTLRTHLQNERFDIVTSVRGLPLDVRGEMQQRWGTAGLDIAEPGAEFQKTGGAINAKLPSRRLVAAGCAADFHCLVYYERGGAAQTWYVMLFHWTADATRFEWGGAAPGGLATIDAVRKAVLSGAVKGHNGPW